ncbi:MAG TPA: polyphosphate kinase 1 [Xanthomonadales bacterium]|nr:polyphosphate kinase 1 [Xanthomonadales bacterium]
MTLRPNRSIMVRMTKSQKILDRDVGQLEFNRRVLALAQDERTPLLERVFFLCILTSNLDEFFMKRVSMFCRKGQVLDEFKVRRLRELVLELQAQQAACFKDDIRPALANEGIHLLSWEELEAGEQEEAGQYFSNNVYPVLTPQAVDTSHPFPFISNLSDSLVLRLLDPETHESFFARVKIPQQLPQWIELKSSAAVGQRRYVALRTMIQQHLGDLFAGMTIDKVLPIRVTRSAVVDIEHAEASDLLEQVEEELRERRQQFAVRLEHPPEADPWLLERITREFQLSMVQIYEMPGELDYTDLNDIAMLPLKKLRYPAWQPRSPIGLEDTDSGIFKAIRTRDIFVHHPYDSFDSSVLRMIRAAVDDKDVVAIKMTLYRTSDDNPFIPWLIEAAEAGKQVTCLVELKARFDEQRNIRWANALRDAGVNVVHGVLGVKTHTKCMLIVRREGDAVRSYAHIGTGNYHPVTARFYTDMGLLTCNSELTREVATLFHYLTGRAREVEFNRLLIAPMTLKKRLLEMIEQEVEHKQAGRPARIIAKLNQLEDKDIIKALYQASQAGVRIDLIVRGFCVLRPGVENLSPTIRVISVVGRFLEHSRVYYFRNGAEKKLKGEFYIGSADWMNRNLEHRIEAVTPVFDHGIRKRIWNALKVMRADKRQAWEMQGDGSYVQLFSEEGDARASVEGTHQALMDRTSRRSISDERWRDIWLPFRNRETDHLVAPSRPEPRTDRRPGKSA